MDKVLALADWAGQTVILTRPTVSVAKTEQALTSAGAEVIHLPFFEMVLVPKTDVLRDAWQTWQQTKKPVVVFVSPASVHLWAACCAREGLVLPAGVTVLAIGQATAAALAGHGVTEVIYPLIGSDANALLDHLTQPAFQGWCWSEKSILIVRGEAGQGSEHLQAVWQRQGATVIPWRCYRRLCVPESPARLTTLLDGFCVDDPCAAALSAVQVLVYDIRTLRALAVADKRVFGLSLWTHHAAISQAAEGLGWRACYPTSYPIQ